jgi:serine-type D-Ala-D-Ala endopeptidase (penicillin-binding protein 7)
MTHIASTSAGLSPLFSSLRRLAMTRWTSTLAIALLAVTSAAWTGSAEASTRQAKKPVAQKAQASKKTAVAAKPAKSKAVATNSRTARKASAKEGVASTRQAKASARVSQRDLVAQRVMVRGKNGKRVYVTRYVPRAQPVVFEPPRLSFGQIAGLHRTEDPLELKSSVALVIDQDTSEVLFNKNENAVLPIASLTKLMTALVISEARLDMNEAITITNDEIDTEKGTRSRLAIGTTLSRGEMMKLALMSSENRAAHALGRTYPGGMPAFVSAMNAKARMLGMNDTRYVEPTGLSSRNQSSARDLATLAAYASNDRLVRELSISDGLQVDVGTRTVNYVNTNRLVRNPEWEIGLQKTGFISEAGHTLVMQTKVAGRRLIMVFLDSVGKLSRLGDAERVRKWVEGNGVVQKISDSAQAPNKGKS